MVLVKNLKFLDFFFLGKIDLKKSALRRSRKKTRHPRLKNINLRSRKTGILPKGVSPWFGENVLDPSFLGKIG